MLLNFLSISINHRDGCGHKDDETKSFELYRKLSNGMEKESHWMSNTTFDESKAKYMCRNADESTTEQAGLGDLFKTSNLRIKTLNVCLCWFANLILFILGLVKLPSYIALVFTLDHLGRRSITSTRMLIGGVCCILAAYIEQATTIATGIVMVEKFMIAGSFAVIYNYSAELFPIVVRNFVMGLGSVITKM